MRWLPVILGVFILMVIVTLVYTYYRLDEVINTHVPTDHERPGDYDLSPEEVELEINDRKISAYYISADEPKAGLVLVHGYGRPKSGKVDMLKHAKYLQDEGYATLLIDLYGFGESDGNKVTFGRDEWQEVKASYEWLRSRKELEGKRVGLFGISYGASTVLITAGKEQVGDFLIASVPFATLDNLFTKQSKKEGFPPAIFMHFVRPALSILIPGSVDALDYAGSIKVPTLIFEAQNDEENLAGDGELLADAIADSKLVKFETGHDIYTEQSNKFETEIIRFLDGDI